MNQSPTQIFLDDSGWSPDVLGTLAAMEHEVETLRQRERLQTAALARLTEQVAQAGQMQRRLLASCIPAVEGAEIHAFYRPAEAVGGDFYDIVRIDETRVALVIADATGHGFAAGLLSTLVKGSVGARRRARGFSESNGPTEVLAALNHELLNCSLSDCEFVTAVYAVYDERSRVMCWSRGGAPYPVLVRGGRPARPCRSDGLALGVHEDARFETKELRLEPGDMVVFHTDGLDALFTGKDPITPMSDAPPEPPLCKGGGMRSAWFDDLARHGAPAQFAALDDRIVQLDGAGWHVDDVTAVALHVRE
jgi:serine phosphatase RsbU (regulator of sigma subunit)